MVIRQTSIESYHKLEETGKLGKLQKEVYEYIKETPECTQGECAVKLKKERVTVGPRFAELYNKGLIDICSKRKCRTTGVNVITWKSIPKREVKIVCCPMCKQVIRKDLGEKESL